MQNLRSHIAGYWLLITGWNRLSIQQRSMTNWAKKLQQKTGLKVVLRVIGSGAPGESASLFLSTPTKKYLFNCGENFDRLRQNNSEKIAKVNNIFLTQTSWKCMGGIVQLCFSAIQSNDVLPQFHGAPSFYKCVKRILCLSRLDQFPFSKMHFNANNYYEDSVVRIDFVRLNADDQEIRANENSVVIAYICHVKSRRGNFSLTQCVDKNVPPGPLLKELHQGKSVTLDDGTVVTAEDVHTDFCPAINFIIIDIPSESYLNNLANNQQLNSFLNANEKDIEAVVHFSPQHIIDKPEYQQFIQKTGANNHCKLNESNTFSHMSAAYMLQEKLHGIDEDIHPLLGMSLNSSHTVYDANSIERSENIQPQVFSAYILRGNKNKEQIEIDDSNKVLAKPKKVAARDHIFPRIVFLGTGSGSSSPLRNATSILVHTTKDAAILLDCGQGTCGQIHRFYGHRAPEVFRKIKGVFVSHMHLDHHIGLPELFQMRKEYLPADRPPLPLMCPMKDLKSWLIFYAKNFEPIFDDMKFIDNDNLMAAGLSYDLCRYLGINMFRTCRVKHFKASYGVTMSLPSDQNQQLGIEKPFKLTFSGDTIPCKELVSLGKNSTVLIHEATHQDELHATAKVKMHSTFSQAISQGHEMNAKFTILTHFSQRYAQMPPLDHELNPNVGIAFDNMELVESDLSRLNGLIPKYRDLFEKQSLQNLTEQYMKVFDNHEV